MNIFERQEHERLVKQRLASTPGPRPDEHWRARMEDHGHRKVIHFRFTNRPEFGVVCEPPTGVWDARTLREFERTRDILVIASYEKEFSVCLERFLAVGGTSA